MKRVHLMRSYFKRTILLKQLKSLMRHTFKSPSDQFALNVCCLRSFVFSLSLSLLAHLRLLDVVFFWRFEFKTDSWSLTKILSLSQTKKTSRCAVLSVKCALWWAKKRWRSINNVNLNIIYCCIWVTWSKKLVLRTLHQLFCTILLFSFNQKILFSTLLNLKNIEFFYFHFEFGWQQTRSDVMRRTRHLHFRLARHNFSFRLHCSYWMCGEGENTRISRTRLAVRCENNNSIHLWAPWRFICQTVSIAKQ